MASSSGTSSWSIDQLHQQTGSDRGCQSILDQKKRKRMISNRESARRSRIRKQKRLDDLVTQVSQLSGENSHMVSSMKLTGQMYLNIDAENSILRAQLAELTHRLESLNQITNCLNSTGGFFETDYNLDDQVISNEEVDSFMNPWNSYNVNHPIIVYPIV